MPNENSYEVALQKSNAIREGLAKTPEKFTMLTGDRPTGRLHLGQILKVAQLDQATLLLLEQMQQLPGQHPVQEGLGIVALIHEPVTEYERCTISLPDRFI